MAKHQKVLLIFFSMFTFMFCMMGTPAKAHAASHSVSTFEQLQSALADGDGTIDITISGSFDMEATVTIPAGKIVSISSDSGPYVLTRGVGATGDLFTVSAGARLSLSDITIDGNKTAVPDAGGSLVLVATNGSLAIQNNATLQNHSYFNYNGTVHNSGTMTMSGGTIRDNATMYAGGVYNIGDFTMSGGEISGNASSYDGSGVYNAGTFTLTGGVIHNNVAYGSPYGGGGGVFNSTSGVFLMAGGTIRDNFAQTGNGRGGGVYNAGDFTMTGGEISGNDAFSHAYGGGGVYNSGIFNMSSGIIAKNSAFLYGGGVHNHNGNFAMTGGEISGNTASYGGGGVDNYGTFEMSGGTIEKNITPIIGGGIYNRNSFTMHNGQINGNEASYGGGIYNAGELTMLGGFINDNTASEEGGGIINITIISLRSGTISGNKAVQGGGIANWGQLDMADSTISNNEANFGGGISNNTGVLLLSGNIICGNAASLDGGGIYSTYTVNLSNDTISDNAAARDGGGIFMTNHDYLDLAAGSTAFFSNNTAGSLSVPPETAPVPKDQWQGKVTSISPRIPGDKNITVFNNFDINFDGDPFAGPFPVIYHANNGSGNEVDAGSKFPYQPFPAADNPFTAPNGKRFAGWNTKADGSGATYLPGDEVIMPNEDAPFTFDLYAMWESIPITPGISETPTTTHPPKTGDTNALSLYGLLLCAMIGVVGFAVVFAKMKRMKG